MIRVPCMGLSQVVQRMIDGERQKTTQAEQLLADSQLRLARAEQLLAANNIEMEDS